MTGSVEFVETRNRGLTPSHSDFASCFLVAGVVELFEPPWALGVPELAPSRLKSKLDMMAANTRRGALENNRICPIFAPLVSPLQENGPMTMDERMQ